MRRSITNEMAVRPMEPLNVILEDGTAQIGKSKGKCEVSQHEKRQLDR